MVLLVFLFVFGGTKIFRSFSETKDEYRYLTLFSEVVSLVKTDYVEKVQPEEKFPGAFSGMLGILDQCSSYLDARQGEIYELFLQGKAYGCGIYGTRASNYFLITDVDKDSPAGLKGVEPGSIIKAVNGTSVYGQTFWQMYLSLFSGKPGTIELILLKESTEGPLKVQLETRPQVNDPRSAVKKIQGGVLLVQLPRIDSGYTSAIKQFLQKENDNGKPVKLIIDLRRYSGGDLDSFIQLTGLFFNKSAVPGLVLKSKSGEKNLPLGSNHPLDYKAAVLINESTIMYGELLANLFKMSPANATLLGSKTEGFISKLKHIPLTDGTSVVLTGELFFLEGKNLAVTGVKPDISLKDKDFAGIIKRGISILEKNQDDQNPKKEE
jgi:carboxyl-terminal processing protease